MFNFVIGLLFGHLRPAPAKRLKLDVVLKGFNEQIEELFALADQNDGLASENSAEIDRLKGEVEGLRARNLELSKEGHAASTIALKLQGLISAE